MTVPVEIKELVIRAVVDQGVARHTSDGEGEEMDRRDREWAEDVRRAVVEECVKEVLRILRASKER